MKDLDGEATHVGLPGENAVHPEVLCPDVRTEILPLRILRIRRRLHRIWSDVAEPASHSDSIRPDQLLVVVIAWVFVKALGIPFLRCSFVEVRIRKQSQSHNPGRITVVRTGWNVVSPRA